MKFVLTKLVPTAVILLALPVFSASAGDKPFPDQVPALLNSLPEGFAIGKGTTAYNGSVDGSIYKVDLRTGAGEILNPDEPTDLNDCSKLGMRVDSRTNYLFVAGCFYGTAHVYDADTGDVMATYQLGPDDDLSIVNDVTITKDAAYFTDSFLPNLYRVPLGRNGAIPPNEDGVTIIDLPPEFDLDPSTDPCCGGNGIAATPNGKTLIVGHSNLATLYRVDPATGVVDEIDVNPPLEGFLDGIVLHGRTVYIMNPATDTVDVVELDKEMLTGEFVGTITDPSFSGVASGALFGKSLYVNNAHYDAVVYDEDGLIIDIIYDERWITKVNRHAVEPVE